MPVSDRVRVSTWSWPLPLLMSDLRRTGSGSGGVRLRVRPGGGDPTPAGPDPILRLSSSGRRGERDGRARVSGPQRGDAPLVRTGARTRTRSWERLYFLAPPMTRANIASREQFGPGQPPPFAAASWRPFTPVR